ncbi:MAG: LysM peptidoglycan-binding domain-containing protein [Dehalococcoidia bacterium]|nr:LysM peptidoglycan-binding domain-containing protein [Dehalococcoidia bacterium]
MTAASPIQARSTRFGLVALIALLALVGMLLWRFIGPPAMLASVPDWGHVREVLGGAQLRDDDVVAVAGGLAWLAIGYLAISVLLRVVLGTASSITGGAAWARTGLRVTEPLTLPFVRHLVDGALAGTIVLTASFQPGLAAASSGEAATVSLTAPTHSRQAIDSVAPAPAPDSAPEQATLVATSYTVVSGDSLWAIAERLLGDGFRWTELWNLNQHRQMPDGRTFTNPNLIYAGWTLDVPQDETALPLPSPDDLEEEDEAEPTPVIPTATAEAATPQPMPSAAPGGIIEEGPSADETQRPKTLPSLPTVPPEFVGGAAATLAAAGIFVFVFRNRYRGGGAHRDERRERRPSGVGDAGRVLAMSRVLHQALADSDFADTRIVLVRETDRFLEFTLDSPPGDADALVAARHILSREIGCSVDGTEVAPTHVRLKLSRFNRLASELFHESAGGSLLIVPVGATDDGIYYLNLLACGSALITGGRLESRDLVSSWLATFASLYGADEIGVIAEEASVAHIGDALSGLVGAEGHEPVASVPDLARQLESMLAEDRQGFLSSLVALAGPLPAPRDATAELEMVLRSGKEHGIVSLASAEVPVDVETRRLWGAQISFHDQPGREARGLTLSLPRHPQLELQPVTIRRQTASRPPVRHPEPDPVPAPAENGHSNGNGHQHEPPFELPELPPLRSGPVSDQVLKEPEAELLTDVDEDSPEPAPPANPSALSRQSALPMTDDGEEAVASSAGPLFKVRCFGSFRVEAAEGEVSGWTIQKARELLAFLLAHGGAPVLRETVAEALWPDGDLDQVSHQLSNAAYYLRRTLASAVAEVDNRVLVTANQRYHLRSGLFRVDVDAFDAHIARAEKLQGYEALVEYERALAIYADDFMGDEAFEWAEVYRRDYQKRFVTAAHRAARLAFDSRDQKLAIRFYDAILARDPIDEEAVRGIMRSHAALGDTNAVRRTYKALSTALRRELEDDAAEPLPETTKLLESLIGTSVSRV